MVTVECASVGCSASARIGLDGGDASRVFEVREAGFGDVLRVYLPEGWRVDANGLDEVVHCPEHAS